MKICKRCNIEMEYYKPSDGPYYICVKCNRVDYPLEENQVNLGNTFLIDEEYDKEVDKIVNRGRD
jgi:hypothetical protein